MRKFFLAAAVAVAAILGSTSTADAAFRMRIESGTTTGPGVTLTATVGSPDVITFNGAIGGFVVNVTTGLKTPTLALPGYFEGLDLSNVSINTSAAGTLRIILEFDGFTTAPNGALLLTNSVGGVLSGPAGSTAKFDSYANPSAGQPDLGVDVGPPAAALLAVTGIGDAPAVLATQTFGPGAFSGDVYNTFTKSGTYSLYSVVTVNFTGAGSVSFNHITETSPAPAGLILALTGTPVLGIGAWIRRRRAGTAV